MSHVDNVLDMGKGFVIVMCHFSCLLFCILLSLCVVHISHLCFTLRITVCTVTCQNASCQPLCLWASSSRNVHVFWHQEPHAVCQLFATLSILWSMYFCLKGFLRISRGDQIVFAFLGCNTAKKKEEKMKKKYIVWIAGKSTVDMTFDLS